jgi:hypothetical protein
MGEIEGHLKVLGKTFYNITTKNLDIEYCNIQTITNSICLCMYLAEKETSVIVIDGVTMYKIDKILNKYFRQNFIKALGGTSIEDYIFDNNNSFEACFDVIYIKTEKFNLKKEKQIEFEDWVLKINKHIERYKKFNRWNDLTIKSLLDEVTLEEYENEGIRHLINNYFKKEIKYILSVIHLNIRYGFIKSNRTKKLEPKETELSEKIKKHFGFFNGNCPRKHKLILKDNDFDKLIEWTIWYFENDFKVPIISDPIKVVNTNKTFVQLAFKYLFKELHKSSPYPETLFKLYQGAFNPYSEDKKSNFEAVKNNDEVKNLMQIEY